MESPALPNDHNPELEFTSYLDAFPSKSDSENISTFQDWFARDEFHNCNNLLKLMEANGNQSISKSIEAQELKHDFEIYDKTVGII